MKLKTVFILILIFFTLSSFLFSKDEIKTYFGVVEKDDRIGAWPFIGYYENQIFHNGRQKDYDRFLKSFLLEHDYNGVMENNEKIKIGFSNYVMDHDKYESAYILKKNSILGNSINKIALFWSSDVEIKILEKVEVKLNSSIIKKLVKQAEKLYKDALKYYFIPNHHLGEIHYGTPQIYTTSKSSNIVSVFFPGRIQSLPGDKDIDNRASAFFIYLKDQNKIIYQKFGHPEWAGSIIDSVKIVKPLIYFSIGKSKNIYMLATYGASWEGGSDFAIFNYKTGKVVLSTGY